MDDVLAPRRDEQGTLPFTKVDVLGRCEHTPIFINERGEKDFVSPHTISEFFVENVRRFQLKVEGPTACSFRICLKPGLGETERERSINEVRERFGVLLAQKEMRNVDYRIEVLTICRSIPKRESSR
jgi:hypothetical protein